MLAKKLLEEARELNREISRHKKAFDKLDIETVTADIRAARDER